MECDERLRTQYPLVNALSPCMDVLNPERNEYLFKNADGTYRMTPVFYQCLCPIGAKAVIGQVSWEIINSHGELVTCTLNVDCSNFQRVYDNHVPPIMPNPECKLANYWCKCSELSMGLKAEVLWRYPEPFVFLILPEFRDLVAIVDRQIHRLVHNTLMKQACKMQNLPIPNNILPPDNVSTLLHVNFADFGTTLRKTDITNQIIFN